MSNDVYMTTAQLTNLVRIRFAPPQFATFTNVSNGTGTAASRWADVITMSIWPSRGLQLYGMELKRDRADWLRELTKPEKADAIFRYCDGWFLVSSPGVAVLDEIPRPWGWIEASAEGKKLITRKDAPCLTPEAMPRRFLAALLRRATEQSADIAELKKAFNEGFADGEKNGLSKCAHIAKDFDRLQKHNHEFETASGIKIDGHTWNCNRIGEIVKFIMNHDVLNDMRTLIGCAEKIAEEAKLALVELEANSEQFPRAERRG